VGGQRYEPMVLGDALKIWAGLCDGLLPRSGIGYAVIALESAGVEFRGFDSMADYPEGEIGLLTYFDRWSWAVLSSAVEGSDTGHE
jgi:hypothetical protein